MFGSRDAKAHPSRAAAGDEGADPGASEPAAPALPPRLVDLASDWLVLIPALRACADLPDAGRLRAHATELRTAFERNAKQAGFADADVQSAVFSLTAVFDETVKRARGKAREEWLARSRPLHWVQTAHGGVAFYTRLHELRKERNNPADSVQAAACRPG